MSRSKKESLVYSTAKNLVRGALSNKKGKPVHALSDGLSHLDLNDIRRLGAWIEQYPAKRTRLFPPPKIDNYNDLWPNAFLNVPDLLTALSWVAQLLSRHTVSVQCFLHHLSAYELAYLSCDYESAARTLDQIEVELGLSIWLIEARLGLIHRSKGLEAQKQYAQSIQIAAPKSGPAYVAHYASQRNEDSSSMDRYSTRITASVDKQPVTDNIKLYLKR